MTLDHIYFALLNVAATQMTRASWWHAVDGSQAEAIPDKDERSRRGIRLQQIIGSEIHRVAGKLWPDEMKGN